jgi:tetratricopeptide (TPR) repeat protein
LWECGQKSDSKQVVIHIEYMVPRQPPVMYRYALIAMKHGLNDIAVDMLERAIRAKPTASYYVALGDAQRAKSNYAHALQAYRQALVLDPSHKDIHGLISSISPLSPHRPRPGNDPRNTRNDTK